MADKKLVKKLDKVHRLYIRKRDAKDGYFRCCSCNTLTLYENGDAGHWINCKWMATRWRDDNVHSQCRPCNRFDEGNGPGYTVFMINKYGQKHVDYLLALKRETAKFTDTELELMIKDYQKRGLQKH